MTFEEMWQELEKQDTIFIKARKLADIEVKKIEEEHNTTKSAK